MVASRSWSQSRITIGRGEECTLVLEDPKKHVSRVHVELEEKPEGIFGITVVSKVNPVFIDGKRQAPGSRAELSAGDSFEIGDYQLELLPPPPAPKVDAVVPEAEETTRPNSQLPSSAPAVAATPASIRAAAPAAAAVDDHADVEEAIRGGTLPPVEEGLFDDIAPEVAPAPVAKAPPPPAAPIQPAPPGASEEATFMGKPALSAAELAALSVPPAPAAPAQSVFEEATYVGGSAAAGASAPAASSIYEEATYVGGRPPAQATAPLGARAPRGIPAAPSGGAELRRVVQAFLDGAGLAGQTVSDAEAEEFMRQSGAIVRAAVEGVMTLLAARATAKKELRAEDRTMVASKDNNPLKLMSDPQEAMAFLFDLKEKTGGFLGPVKAVGDAFDDLRVHEVALIAGMRAALLGTIQRFDAKTLESELEKAAGGLGLNRKAKLWELFAAYQEKLARDAGEDFNKVFGREFMGTYMAQVKRLRGG